MINEQMSLNNILISLGYTTEPAGWGAKNIRKENYLVFSGNCFEVFNWLRESKQINW